jgi:uncharacterized membrane protein (UPF0127 family)
MCLVISPTLGSKVSHFITQSKQELVVVEVAMTKSARESGLVV